MGMLSTGGALTHVLHEIRNSFNAKRRTIAILDLVPYSSRSR